MTPQDAREAAAEEEAVVRDCLRCHGAGEVQTREVDHETGWPLTETCWTCGGEGFMRGVA